MKSYRLSIHLFLFTILSYSGFAQESQNTLLWKIEGKGLTQASYLYGTMHVSDKRVFNFSDSVFIAIENCEAFALEIHPDSAMLEMIKSMQESFDNAYYEDLLTEDEFDRFKEKFKKINGYDFDDLDNKNPLSVQYLLEPDHAKSDDKQTFVDAYLFSVAKMLRKDISGLEDYKEQIRQIKGISKSDQKEMIMGSVDYPEQLSKMMREEMVKVYATGDLDKMKTFLGNTFYNDSLMILRNKVMTESIIKVSKEKSLFSAIGAAHLIGKGSVLQMLKDKGYTVTPVTPIYTGLADEYVPDLMKMPWITYTDSIAGFNVELPGEPNEFNKDLVNMMMYLDMSTESAYAFMHLDVRNEPDSFSIDQMIELFISNLDAKNLEIESQKFIESDYGDKVDLLIKQDKKMHFRAQISKVNGFMYYLFLWGKKDNLYTPAADRFLNSSSYFEPAPQEVKSGWFTYTDSTNAFSVKLPSYPKELVREVPNPENPEGENYHVDILYSMDMANSMNYMIAYNDVPIETYIDDTNEALNLLIEELKTGGNTVENLDTIDIGGVPGRSFDCILAGGFHSKVFILQRGNRTYKVFKQVLKANQNTFTEDVFMESFTMLPYKNPTFVTRKSGFENESFLEFENSNSNSSDVIDYDSYFDEAYSSYSKNINSGGLYQVDIFKLNDFFKIENIDTFYNKFASGLLDWNDSLIQSSTIEINDRKRYEVLQNSNNSASISKFQFWIHNDIFYFLGVNSTLEEIESDFANAFFTSFEDNNSGVPFDYYTSKSKKIIEGLNSKDTLLQNHSIGALKSYYEFEEDDLTILHQSITKSYPDDTLSGETKCLLINELALLENSQSIVHLKNLYQKPKTSTPIKESILNALASINTKESIDEMIDLLFTSPPDSLEYSWSIFYPLVDSLDLFKANLDKMVVLFKNDNYKSNILQTITSVLNTNKDAVLTDIEPYFDILTNSALDEIKEFLSKKEADPDKFVYNQNIFNYIALMNNYLNRSITDEYTELFIKKDTFDYTKAYAISTRIKNNLEIDMNLKDKLIDSISTRYLIFEAYIDINRLDQFPSKYLTPTELAKMKLYEYFTNEDYFYPDRFELLDELKHQEEKYFIFNLGYNYGDEKYNFVTTCGPIQDNDKSTVYKDLKVSFDWHEMNENWKSNAIELLKLKDDD